ncbi:MAG: hypothetical protein EXQ90_08065 [Rhodospirillales bacterium]|nr:hypothetical protein [Rhodospirillales bacterium]
MYLTDASEANPYAEAAASRPPTSGSATSTEQFQPFGKDGLSFGDVLDVINPLQHIPIVSAFYRRITGDEIAMAPRIIGDGLFGGFIGFVASLANIVVEQTTGKDVGEHVATLMLGEPDAAPTAVATANTGETDIEGLPWLQTASLAAPVTAGPPAALPPRSLSKPIVNTPVASLSLASNATTATTIGEAAADPFIATRLAGRPNARPRQEASAAPLGGTADPGGWFSEVMLTALDRYQATSKLGESSNKPRVDLTH